ncbi:hypothetical protein OESDEN_17074 [Oesophagostomum dentatum]|uniref:Uncharacterized protein n=1 Tax=Oesophagostomum dentatum TaxID=61180 RepID=A0A0B1SJ56_OESDE|nr:hypothetical protein OESDEN_17074 [Oesophagostomum dentatum]
MFDGQQLWYDSASIAMVLIAVLTGYRTAEVNDSTPICGLTVLDLVVSVDLIKIPNKISIRTCSLSHIENRKTHLLYSIL